jgi:hypothetical protein
MNIKIMVIAFVFTIHQLAASERFLSNLKGWWNVICKKEVASAFNPDGTTRTTTIEKLKSPREIWQANPGFIIVSGV